MTPASSRGPSTLAASLLEYVGVLLLAAPFFVLTVRNYLRLDLWFDEIQSLEDFILVPLGTTVSDYRFPNNHVLFSVLTNLALRGLRVRDLFALMDSPWILRSLMLAVSTLTLLALYATGKRFFGRRVGAMAAVMLATTVPFYNFAVQVRGYILSMLLLCVLLLLVWRLEERPTAGTALGVAGISALIMYTIPLNLYVLAAIAACQGGFALAHLLSPRSHGGAASRGWRPHAAVMACLAAGVTVSTLLYLPILHRVLHNRYVAPSTEFNPAILIRLLPQVMEHLLSGRWALLALVPVGMTVLARQLFRGGDPAVARRYLLLGAVLVLPFLFSFLRRDRPYDRVFVNLAPPAALFLALNADLAMRAVDRFHSGAAVLGSLAIVAYCLVLFPGEVQRKDRFLLAKINAPVRERKTHDIAAAFFQARYRPNEIARLTSALQARRARPLQVFLGPGIDKQALPRQFLQKSGIAFEDVCRSKPRNYPEFTEALIVSTHPRAFEATIRRQLPGTRCSRVNPEPWFINVYACEKG